jgi:hypothetical protein
MNTFNREELKYIVDTACYDCLFEALSANMQLDHNNRSGKTYSIYSVYFDTPDYKLGYLSFEKEECYRYKIRVRSYTEFGSDNTSCSLEMKKKVSGVSNKRRIKTRFKDACDFIATKDTYLTGQLIDEFKHYFSLTPDLIPQVHIKYDRTAFAEGDLRVTLDNNVVTRSLTTGETFHILPENRYILEVKSFDSIPLWLAKTLSSLKIYPAPFSKYGETIKQLILRNA